MKWKKLGQVYVASGKDPWAMSHAFVPTPVLLPQGRIRIYVAFQDSDKVGRVGFVEVDAANPRKVLNVSRQPVLDIGTPGAFDDSGVTPLSIVEHEGKYYLYYVGWQLGVRVRYYLFLGLAISTDGGLTFTRHSHAPVLDRTDEGLFVRGSAHVGVEGAVWRMWYVSGSDWVQVQGKNVPTYDMKYLESTNGIDWAKGGKPCLTLAGPDEFGFARPFVIREEGQYRMWYSVRTFSKGYRLGYAESTDGRSWTRKDTQAGIDVSATGWDSAMVGFAAVVRAAGSTFLFYNGNNYGETGFGVAVLE
jgi:predicted GH43/DUF377 family glycosyl hydrolase